MLAGAIAVWLFPLCAFSQTRSGFPVDIIPGPSPQPVMADGRCHFLYELHLTNFAPLPIELTRIDVLGEGANALATYRGPMLAKSVIAVEKLSSADLPSEREGAPKIGEGHAVMIFVDLTLDPAVSPPVELRHRFSFSITRKTGAPIERTLDGPIVTVARGPAPLLHAPLGGSTWVAFNALGAEDHRRSMNAVDGRERIPQRFAIDWMRLGSDGRLFHGDSKSNANFYGYGAKILAVADGRVSDVKDGIPDNVGTTERSARDITLDNLLGNYVTLDLGQGRFAVYAHLQPGTLRAKLGDTVKAGQVLALLGNSGNSDAPHLHFQLVNANSPLESEGIPYELETFTQLGVVPDEPAVQDNGGVLLRNQQERRVVRRTEFPLNNTAMSLP